MTAVRPDDVDAWLDGDLDPVRAAEVARAVAADPALGALAERHRAIRRRLGALEAPRRDLRAGVLARIGAAGTAPRPRPAVRAEWIGLAVAAAAAVWLAWPAPPRPPPASSPAALRLVSPPPGPTEPPEPLPAPLPVVGAAPIAAPAPSNEASPEQAPPPPESVPPAPPDADVVLQWTVTDADHAWMAHRLAGRAGGTVPVPLAAGDVDDGAATLVVAVPGDVLATLVMDLAALGRVERQGLDGLLRDGLVRVRIDVRVASED